MRKLLSIGILLVAALNTVSWADPNLWQHQLSLEGGLAVPTEVNNFSDGSKVGPMAGARYLYRTSDNFAWGIQGDLYHFPAKDHVVTGSFGANIDTRSTDNVATLEIVGRYMFLPDANIHPYIHSGVGGNYFHQKTEGQPTTGAGWADTGTTETRQLQNAGFFNFSYSAGLGIETDLTNTLTLGLEAAWHIFGVNKSDFGTSTINVPTASVRLGWRFGQFSDEIQPH